MGDHPGNHLPRWEQRAEVIALDTNLLVYAHRPDAQFHQQAHKLVTELAAGTEHWAVPWPCAHEFVAIVTHPRIYRKPTPLPIALQALPTDETIALLGNRHRCTRYRQVGRPAETGAGEAGRGATFWVELPGAEGS